MKRLVAMMSVLVGFTAVNALAGEKAEPTAVPAAVKERPADVDKDGKVSKEEFVAHAKKNAEKAGNEFKEKRAAAIFAKRDVNEDGFLTAEDKAEKKASEKAASE